MEREIIWKPKEVPRVKILNVENIIRNDHLISNYLVMCKIWQDRGFSVYIINPSEKFLSKTLLYDNIWLVPQKEFTIEFYNIPLVYNEPPYQPDKYTQTLSIYKLVNR